MKKLQDAPWVSQCISMVTVVPARFVQNATETTVAGIPMLRMPETPAENITSLHLMHVMDMFHIPERYKNLLKFYTSPYCVIEMTAYNGGEIVLKPECLQINSYQGQDSILIVTETVVARPTFEAIRM